MRFCLTVIFSFLFLTAFSQWTLYPVKQRAPVNHATKKTTNSTTQRTSPNSPARIDSVGDTAVYVYLKPLQLPFFDDFSSSNSRYYPDSTKWQYGKSVSWNLGVGKNPPSLGVVSFDGLDSLESPYDVTNNLDKGIGDQLRSWTLKLDSIPAEQRDSTFLTFAFEYQGNGEHPDPGDHLLVEFRNDSNQWIAMAQVDLDTSILRKVLDVTDSLKLTNSVFYSISIPVNDPAFFHNQFQFRISSFGRISGPWDTWIVDYVYLNTHGFKLPSTLDTARVADNTRNNFTFPDRAIYSPTSSILGNYWSIPATHFHQDSVFTFIAPSFGITNNRQDQTIGQPLSFNSSITINEWKAGASTSSKTVQLDSAAPAAIAHLLLPNEHRLVPWLTLPPKTSFTTDSDSIDIEMKSTLNSKDNLINGDYQQKFAPINFQVNDVSTSVVRLRDYYGYDDGSAEFAAGLNLSGTEIAYRFDMITSEPDFILGVDLYFPNVGDESAQTIYLIIRNDTTTKGVLYSEYINLQRSSENKFIHHTLDRNSVRVQGHFYVGYRQVSSAIIAVGLDTSHDTTDKIFFNVAGYWEQPFGLYGSLMIHPVMGAGVYTGLEKPVTLDIFPNPNSGTFYFSTQPDHLQIIDFTGNKVEFQQGASGDKLKVDLSNPSSGIYLVKYWINGKPVTRRVLVQH